MAQRGHTIVSVYAQLAHRTPNTLNSVVRLFGIVWISLMTCEHHECRATVTSRILYGLYSEYEKGRPHHSVNLCEMHQKELWGKSQGLVSTGLMHWEQDTLKDKGNG